MKASTLFAFLAGAAVGSIVALLLTPENEAGKKIRQLLKEYGIELNEEELKEFINSIRNQKDTAGKNHI
jgi:gas vesicle protein